VRRLLADLSGQLVLEAFAHRFARGGGEFVVPGRVDIENHAVFADRENEIRGDVEQCGPECFALLEVMDRGGGNGGGLSRGLTGKRHDIGPSGGAGGPAKRCSVLFGLHHKRGKEAAVEPRSISMEIGKLQRNSRGKWGIAWSAGVPARSTIRTTIRVRGTREPRSRVAAGGDARAPSFALDRRAESGRLTG
jgi:hypothetical protein